MANEKDIVVDDGRAKWSDLWLKEDYWAIWVGFFIIIIAGLIMINGRSGIEADLAKYNGIIQAEKAKPIEYSFMERYRDIKKHSVPPLAALYGDQCGGCNMSLPSSVSRKVKAGELVECETCGRLLIIV